MPRKIHDWSALKADFLTSNHISVHEWIRDRFGKDMGGNFRNETVGWTEEKRQLREEIKRQVVEEAKAKMLEIYRPSVKELGEMHKATLELYKLSLNKILQDCVVKDASGKTTIVKIPDQSDLEKIWKVVKTEKGEATSVVERSEPLTDDEKDFIDSIIDDVDE